jgi:O-methyltransferase
MGVNKSPLCRSSPLKIIKTKAWQMPLNVGSIGRLSASLAARFKYPMVRAVRARGLTYLSNARLISLVKKVQKIIRAQKTPVIIEFGVALGGSAILMSSLLHPAGRGQFYGYDMFGLIPPPSDNDERDAHDRYNAIVSGQSKGLKGQKYYGYETDLLSKVKAQFKAFGMETGMNLQLIAGDFRQSFQEPASAVDLIHIDCDWYESVVFCLEVAKAHLRVGGLIVVDDYNDYQGCAKAVDAFVAKHSREFKLVTTKPHAVIERVA